VVLTIESRVKEEAHESPIRERELIFIDLTVDEDERSMERMESGGSSESQSDEESDDDNVDCDSDDMDNE
jgi:hypothetical protein